MRWTKHKYMENERHVIRKFALFPIRIGDEIRWLEFVNVVAYYWYGENSGHKFWEYEKFVD